MGGVRAHEMSTHESQLLLASEAISNEQYERALVILAPLVKEEVAGALGLLGAMHQLGMGVPVDGPKTVELLTRAADLGDGVSAHNLGTVYGGGLPGVERDPILSRRYYRRAKELGAQFAPNEFYE